LGNFEEELPTESSRRLSSSEAVVSSFTGPIDLDALYGSISLTKYWTYNGSFTTPPCTEAVDWYPMMEAKVLTQSQLDKMMEAMGWSGAGGNYRPPQPLFGRDVEGCSAAQWYPYKATVWAEQLGEKSAETCRSGEMQSPIDLPECTEEEKRIAITTSWGEQTVKLTNNGHTVQLTIQDAAPSTTALGSSYTLVQCHYHWGSEHTVGGEQAPMVTHCVHTKDGTERYGVVGLFFEVSGSMDNTFLAQFEDHLPTASDAEHRRLTETTDTMDITFNNMLDGIDVQTYWTYDGSLTTPPCSEVVDWFLFMTPAKMTSAQLAKFEAAIGWGDAGGNYRPPQPLFERSVEGCKAATTGSASWYPYDATSWSYNAGAKSSPVCATGQMQSPIDLPKCIERVDRTPIEIAWGEKYITLVNNGHTVQATALDSKGKMKVGGQTYTLVQCHFHWGSEHTIGGGQMALSAHCVHTKDDSEGQYGVLGIFYEVGEYENLFLAEIEDSLPANDRRLSSSTVVSTYSGPIDFDLLVHALNLANYWTYEGSFTTPPCTEAVDWYPLMDAAVLTQAQLSAMQAALGWSSAGGNYRPPQPIYGREVLGCKEGQWYPYSPQVWAGEVGGKSAEVCRSGSAQSPIDLPSCNTPTTRSAITVSYGTQEASLTNNGHTVQLTLEESETAATFAVDSLTYTLLQCHFHWGSEHTIDGNQADMVAHCVHTKDGTDRYGVLAIFYEIGTTSNTFLASIEDKLPSASSTSEHRRLSGTTHSLDFDTIVSGLTMTNYWTYDGSLTTPPCSEVVDWYPLMTKATLTSSQLSKFQAAIGWSTAGGNYRPPQNLNGRDIEGCEKDAWYPYQASNWADSVNNAATVCSEGHFQSPVDLPKCTAATREAISLTYGSQSAMVINNGHTVQLTLEGTTAKMVVGSDSYTLAQCHFHYGSEHTIGGEQVAFVSHCVHSKDDSSGRYGVFAVFFDIGSEANAFLKQFEDSLPDNPESERADRRRLNSVNEGATLTLDFDLLYTGLSLSAYWTYDGSLTTPPCSEVVDWYPLMTRSSLTQAQLDKFVAKIGDTPNYRPPQELQGRVIAGCQTTFTVVHAEGTAHAEEWYPYDATAWATKAGSSSHPICAAGKMQSPIDLPQCTEAETRQKLIISWGTQTVTLANNGHAVQITASASTGTMHLKGKQYTLVQCHWHWGSEHTVGGKQFDLVAHCVHTKDSSNRRLSESESSVQRYGVLAVFYSVGTTENEFLAGFEDYLPRKSSSDKEESHDRRLSGFSNTSSFSQALDLDKIYAGLDLTKYWTYKGSFTTPPCTEVVDWYPLMGSASLTAAQFKKFEDAIGWESAGGNYRPPQPLNERDVQGCSEAQWYPYNPVVWSEQIGSSSSEICLRGDMQSPIDLPDCGEHKKSRTQLSFSWGEQAGITLINNGHTVQLTFSGTPTTTADGSTYTLKQCHFHWGSEHTVGGHQYPLAAHCVHTKDGTDGTHFGVVAFFYEVSESENTFLASFLDHLPSADSSSHSHRRLSDFSGTLNMDLMYSGLDLTKYWTYAGSLTTPPCTEAVDWFPLMDEQTITQKQLDAFKDAIGWSIAGGNYRPPQPQNAREVIGCDYEAWYPYSASAWADDTAKANAICEEGHMQSPVDLPECASSLERPALIMSWGEHDVTLTNNGHTVQLTLVGNSGKFEVTGQSSYTLVQCHFHWGSEHTVDGIQMPMAAHCVHTKDRHEGKYGVIGVLFKEGSTANTFLSKFEDSLPSSLEESEEIERRLSAGISKSAYNGPLDFDSLLKGMDLTSYWTYNGSFTTPPCTELVDWFVMQDFAVLTAEQLEKFKSAIGWESAGGNFRPPQELNGRQVVGCASTEVSWYPYDSTAWSGTVSGANSVCADGQMQSPVDLPACETPEARSALNISWGTAATVEIINNGHTVQINVDDAGTMVANQETYTLSQCHFHWGSEHTIDGTQADMVAHCVQTKGGSSGRYGVTAIFFMLGDGATANPFLAQFENYLPYNPEEDWDRENCEDTDGAYLDADGEGCSAYEDYPWDDCGYYDSDSFIAKRMCCICGGGAITDRRLSSAHTTSSFTGPLNLDMIHKDLDLKYYWSYSGSLTTPPCSELVDWYPLMSYQNISASQLSKFKAAIGVSSGNYRPPQDLNDREVEGCSSIMVSGAVSVASASFSSILLIVITVNGHL